MEAAIHLTWARDPNLGRAEGSVNHFCFPLFLSCVPLLSLSAVGPQPEPLGDSSGNVYEMGRFHSIHRESGSGQAYVLTGMHVKLL